MANTSNQKTAAVILIGNEILSGRTQDKNLAYIAVKLAARGIRLAEAIVIPDIQATIEARVKDYAERYDYVFTTGGIGPTHDDITTASIAAAFSKAVVRNQHAVDCMARYYSTGELTAARLKMADLPEGARLIDNPVSAAPGFQLGNVFVLAGVPSIMRGMFDSLADRLVQDQPILTASLLTNLPESQLAQGLADIQTDCSTISIGSYPYFKHGKVGVNIVLRGTDKNLLLQQAHRVEKLITDGGGVLLATEGMD